ncbi:MAG TPA: molybdopterin cofactor-binding domain-containing protein [Gammaproteobacteria bacterium]
MDPLSVSRRDLLKSSGALVVSFGIGPLRPALAQPDETPERRPFAAENPDLGTFVPAPGDYLDPRELDSWLAVKQDGSVITFTGKVDISGTRTALAQIVAEELDVAFESVTMVMGETARAVDQGRTVGSSTIPRAGTQLRQAAAAARLELERMAAAYLEAPVERLTVNDGMVSVSGDSARRVSYGELVGGRRFDVRITAAGYQRGMEVAPEIEPKSHSNYKIVGTSVPRVDLPAKLTGEYTYACDVRVPGMLHGRVVRTHTAIAAPTRVDESSLAHIPGIVDVVVDGSFVGVVAETEWAAIRGARDLVVEWPAPRTHMPADREEVDRYLTETPPVRERAARENRGDVEVAFSRASRTVEADYHWPFQNHGMMLPSVAVADVQGDRATIWTPAQGPFTTRDRISIMMNVPRGNIDVRYVEASGTYGRLTADDAAEDAVLLSRAVGRPVRVQWMRDDEQVWDPKGGQHLTHVRAAIDADGAVSAWDFADLSMPWTESQGTPQLAERQIGIEPGYFGNANGTGGAGGIYGFENLQITSKTIPWMFEEPMPLRTAALRSPGEPPRVFATESFMDELAAELGEDPVEFRLRYLHDERIAEVLRAAADKAGWSPRTSPQRPSGERILRGRGVAVDQRIGSIPAAVAEVEVDTTTGKVTVARITMAFDCGLIINPDGVRNQIEGNIIQGVSRALLEEVQFDSSGVKSVDWMSYPVLRFREIPDVEMVLINRPGMPALGAAETPIVVVPAAIANAVFDATGVRFREIPLTPERVVAGLQANRA